MNPADAPNLNYAWCGLLVEELIRQGVAGFVISPGSRSAPLTVSVARNERAKYWVHYDERGAAFFALGLAKATGKPAVLVCTSGSAAANYWPAVVEAAMSRIPLILLTADRPPELVDCGANQAIDQNQLYGNYARWYTALPCPTAECPPEYVLTTADQAWYRSQQPMAGPVHINVPLREPLDPREDGSVTDGQFSALASWCAETTPYTRYESCGATLNDATQARLLQLLQTEKRGLLVVGRLDNPADTIAAQMLAGAIGWPVVSDVTTGLRHAPDALDSDTQPRVVLHLGGGFTSKKLLAHLGQSRPHYIHVCNTPQRLDPNHQVTEHLSISVSRFCDWLDGALSSKQQPGMRLGPPSPGAHAPLTEMGVAQHLSALLPVDALLFAGNSMPIRLVDGYFVAQASGIQVAANRGASGIDGNIATALGMAAAQGATTTLLLGDLTALHDINSLALLRHVTAPVIVIVLNNDGGGIFHKLPIARAEEPCFESCFGTPHGLTFAGAAQMFGLAYTTPTRHGDFEAAYDEALKRGGATLIEVRTNRYETDNVLRGRPGFEELSRIEAEDRRALMPNSEPWVTRQAHLDDTIAALGDGYSMPEAMRPVTLAGNPDMPPVLVLHGFMGAREDWMPLAEKLGNIYHVLGVNLPGHGPGWDGFPVENYGMAEIARGLHRHLDVMDIATCGLIGYSMGGRVALYLATLFPERYTQVVLESASPGLDTEEKRDARRVSDQELAERLRTMKRGSEAFRTFLEAWYDMPLFETLGADPEVRSELIERRLKANEPAQLAYSLVGLGTGSQPNLWPYLENYRVRTLLLVGEKDRKYRIIAEDMCAACPAMAVMEFAHCGHIVHLEQPGEFATAVYNFLAMT